MLNYDEQELDFNQYDNAILIDHQGGRTTRVFERSEEIDPMMSRDKIIGVIDHHDTDGEPPNYDFVDIQPVGSASTILAGYLMDQKEMFDEAEFRKVCTALFYGIVTDTNGLTKRVDEKDVDMHKFLLGESDMDIIKKISSAEWSKEAMTLYAKALGPENKKTIDGVTFINIGYVPSDLNYIIHHVADFSLREANVNTVYAMGVMEDTVKVSIRTSDPAFKYSKLQKLFPEAISCGGRDSSGVIYFWNQFDPNLIDDEKHPRAIKLDPTNSESVGIIVQQYHDHITRKLFPAQNGDKQMI
jgi:nanoRNase/pAp phosphatase (c-di-AMP/oligoRNAs hydrolase)